MAYGQFYSALSGPCCPIPSKLFTPTSRMNRCGPFNDFIAGFIPTRKSKTISFWASARRSRLLPLCSGSPWSDITACSTRHLLNSPDRISRAGQHVEQQLPQAPSCVCARVPVLPLDVPIGLLESPVLRSAPSFFEPRH